MGFGSRGQLSLYYFRRKVFLLTKLLTSLNGCKTLSNKIFSCRNFYPRSGTSVSPRNNHSRHPYTGWFVSSCVFFLGDYNKRPIVGDDDVGPTRLRFRSSGKTDTLSSPRLLRHEITEIY